MKTAFIYNKQQNKIIESRDKSSHNIIKMSFHKEDQPVFGKYKAIIMSRGVLHYFRMPLSIVSEEQGYHVDF